MTRINLISPEELSDQNLLAEYRELPRCIKGKYKMNDVPERYTLGKGHVKWAAKYPGFLLNRYYDIHTELLYRGYTLKYTYSQLLDYVYDHKFDLLVDGPGYKPTDKEIFISRQRIIKRYKENPSVHTWTRRKKPTYL